MNWIYNLLNNIMDNQNQNQQQVSSTQPEFPQPRVEPMAFNLPGVKDLSKRAWEIYKARIRVFLGIMLAPLLVSLPIILFTKLPVPIFIVLMIIFMIAVIIIGFWSQISLLYAIKDRDKEIGIKESFAKGWHKIIPYWYISLLVGLIVMGGFLLFIVPGIIFAVWFSLAAYILVAEDIKGMNALRESKRLVSGNWSSVCWRFLFIVLFLGAISLAVSSIAEIFKIPFLEYAVSLFIVPFASVFGFLIYEDLKKLKNETPFEVTEEKESRFY